MKSFEDMQKFGKDNAEATMKSLGAYSRSVQAIAVEMTDYSKKSFEEGAAAAEKLLGAKSIEKAVEVQSDYLKTAYEGFVSRSTKLRRTLHRSGPGGLQADGEFRDRGDGGEIIAERESPSAACAGISGVVPRLHATHRVERPCEFKSPTKGRALFMKGHGES